MLYINKNIGAGVKKVPKVATCLLFLGVALLPVYVFRSGGMQPGHLILFAFALITLLTSGFAVTPWSMALGAMFIYTFAVEGIYLILGGDPRFIINSFYFLYNLLVTVAVYLHVRETGPKSTKYAVLFATALVLGALAHSGVNLTDLEGKGRPTALFNNPNQLGYFSVCLMSIAFLLKRSKHVSHWMAIVVISISIFLAILSLSKAAIIANFFVVGLMVKSERSTNVLYIWTLAALACTGYLFLAYTGIAVGDLLFVERLTGFAYEKDSSLEERGYFTFLEGNALQWIFGMGTQNINEIFDKEVHSTFASTLNNYGIIGLIIFIVAITFWLKRLTQAFGLFSCVCVTAPPLLYGITHNGTRFTFFWLLFALSMALAERERRLQ